VGTNSSDRETYKNRKFGFRWRGSISSLLASSNAKKGGGPGWAFDAVRESEVQPV